MNYRTYKYLLKPTKTQKEEINKTIKACAFLRKQYGNDLDSGINMPDDYKLILSYYLRQYSNLEGYDNSALMNEVFKVRDQRERKVKIIRNSYTTKYTAYMEMNTPFKNDQIFLPKIGWIAKYDSRPIATDVKIRSYTVMKERKGTYSVLVNVTLPEPKFQQFNKVVGFDYSSTHFIVDSNGVTYDIPHFYRSEKMKIIRKHKYLRTKNKGSFRYRRVHYEIGEIHDRIHRRRFDTIHKLTHELAETYDCIVVESLNMKQIATGHKLADATYDNSYYKFVSILDYKMTERGKKLIKIDKWFPSTKTCSVCGYVLKNIDIDTRTWICPNCRVVLDRDINAAINIRNEGLKMLDAGGRLAHH